MTKLAHILLPTHVPDIHMSGETVEGQQRIDRERAPLTKGQITYQKQLIAGKEPRTSALFDEMFAKKKSFEAQLASTGFDVRHAPALSNYSKDAQGNLLYLPELRPWEYTYEKPGDIELSYDEVAVQAAVADISDPLVRAQCATYLRRIQELFVEEQEELQEKQAKGLLEEQAPLQRLDALFAPLERKEYMGALFAITTEEEALSNPLRIRAMVDRKKIAEQMILLRKNSYISKSRMDHLEERYRVLQLATGSINANTTLVDHTY